MDETYKGSEGDKAQTIEPDRERLGWRLFGRLRRGEELVNFVVSKVSL